MRPLWKDTKCKRKHLVIPDAIAADLQKLAILLDQQDHRILKLLEEIDDPQSF
jgi:hypothetical protein